MTLSSRHFFKSLIASEISKLYKEIDELSAARRSHLIGKKKRLETQLETQLETMNKGELNKLSIEIINLENEVMRLNEEIKNIQHRVNNVLYSPKQSTFSFGTWSIFGY